MVNNRWHNKNEIPFQLAHEISHMLNGDEGSLYYCSPASHTKIERGANDKDIDLMYRYGIPSSLEENVKRRCASYFNI